MTASVGNGKSIRSADLRREGAGVAALRRKGVLRMDGAQLTREQSRTGSKEAPHPPGQPELLRQRGTETRVKAFSSEKSAVSRTESVREAAEGPVTDRRRGRHRATLWRDVPKSPGNGAPQGSPPRGARAEGGNSGGRPATPASRTEPAARRAGCTQDKQTVARPRRFRRSEVRIARQKAKHGEPPVTP